jgi:hypothetical protein
MAASAVHVTRGVRTPGWLADPDASGGRGSGAEPAATPTTVTTTVTATAVAMTAGQDPRGWANI